MVFEGALEEVDAHEGNELNLSDSPPSGDKESLRPVHRALAQMIHTFQGVNEKLLSEPKS